jgi:hypothetical protein
VTTQDNFFSLSDLSEVYSLHITSEDNIYLSGTGSTTALWNGKSIPAFRGFTANGADWMGMNDLTHTTATSLFNVDGSAYKILANPDQSFYLGGFSVATNNKGLYLQRFDAAGNIDVSFNFKTGTAHAFYDLTTGDDIIHDMALQNDGKIILVGESNNAGFYTRIMDTSLSAPSFETKNEIVVLSPNPVSNSLNLQFENNQNPELKIVIIDVLGQEVFSVSNAILNSENNFSINNLQSLSKGIYVLKMSSSTMTKSIKFVKE